MDQVNARIRCRNQRCRSKLPIPTDNHHKAFCSRYCYDQFYRLKCVVCEKDLPEEAAGRTLCSARQCRLDYRNFRQSYDFGYSEPDGHPGPDCKTDARSAHFTGVKSAQKAPGARIIAGPPLSDFSLWAATLDPPKPAPVSKPSWCQQPPGQLAAEWTARELARREADDAQYVAEDEARLRTAPVDTSGNYAPIAPDGGV